jgi:EAL domain-containing protein (putative c-di-GMP-specific phosphodiesterase class I)
VVAEGVNDRRIAEALASLPDTVGQGWRFDAPMRPDDLRPDINDDATSARQL